MGAGFGSDVRVVSSEERSTTLANKPAVRCVCDGGKEDGEPKDNLFIIQDRPTQGLRPLRCGQEPGRKRGLRGRQAGSAVKPLGFLPSAGLKEASYSRCSWPF